MHEHAKPPPAGALGTTGACHDLHLNALVCSFGTGKHRDSLHRKRRMRCAGEYFLARRLPVGVARLAGCCGGAVRVGLEDAPLAQRRLLLHIELEDSGIPPRDRRPSGARPVQARLDRSLGRRDTFGATVEYAVVSEGRTPQRRTGPALGVAERIESRVEYVDPTGVTSA